MTFSSHLYNNLNGGLNFSRILVASEVVPQSQDMTAAMVWLERAQDAGAKLGKATFTALIEAMAKKAWVFSFEYYLNTFFWYRHR